MFERIKVWWNRFWNDQCTTCGTPLESMPGMTEYEPPSFYCPNDDCRRGWKQIGLQ